MNDFLGALAARSFGTAGGLRPRVAGWFEPPADAGLAGDPPLLLEQEATTERAPAPRSAPRREAQPPEAAEVPRHPSAPVPRPHAPETAPPPPATAAASMAAEPLTPAMPTMWRNEPSPPDWTPSREQAPASVHHAGEFVAELALAASGLIPKPRETAAREPAPSDASVVAWEPRGAPSPALAEAAPARRQSDPLAPSMQQKGTLVPREATPSAPRQAPARSEASVVDEAAAQPAPTIHITIGRIEVRAVAPAPSIASAPPPRSALQDYLRARQEGKR